MALVVGELVQVAPMLLDARDVAGKWQHLDADSAAVEPRPDEGLVFDGKIIGTWGELLCHTQMRQSRLSRRIHRCRHGWSLEPWGVPRMCLMTARLQRARMAMVSSFLEDMCTAEDAYACWRTANFAGS